MKVVLKGANRNKEIENFFMENIFPILDFGIAIEPSGNIITVYKKNGNKVEEFIDPTAEVVVELSGEVINLIKDKNISDDLLREKAGNFFDEALAIKKIEETPELMIPEVRNVIEFIKKSTRGIIWYWIFGNLKNSNIYDSLDYF